MKSILLTSTALVAFAGAAAADAHAESGVSFAGDATLGYNDANGLGGATVAGDGFYWDATLAATATAALNSGVVASATVEIEIANNNTGSADLDASSYVLSLTSDIASLSIGDLDPVAEDRWGGVDGSTVADFNDQDVHFDVAGFDAMLVGEVTAAGFTAAVSYGVNGGGDIDAMQIHVAGTFGDFGVEVAYQDEFAGIDAIVGVGASASFAGADIAVSYIDDGTETSTGISASYPVGPVVLGGYYSMNDVAEDNYGVSADYANGPISVSAAYDIDGGEAGADDVASYEVDASYDVGNGLTVLGGVFGDDAGGDMGFYAAASYDLGGGATLLASYADDGDDTVLGADLGGPEYKEGMTVEASFAF